MRSLIDFVKEISFLHEAGPLWASHTFTDKRMVHVYSQAT